MGPPVVVSVDNMSEAGRLGLSAGDTILSINGKPASSTVEEILSPAMEDFQLDLLIGQGPSARSVRLDLPRFTLVGATTRAGLLSAPLRDRFGWVARLEYYPPEHLVAILERAARLLALRVDPDAAFEIARRSRGTPRIALRLLRRVRDFAEVEDGRDGAISLERTRFALARLGVDEAGFDRLDRALLRTLVEKFAGGPVGLETLAAALGEDKGTIEDLVEPFLLQEGYLDRTPRGRVATRSFRGSSPRWPRCERAALTGCAVRPTPCPLPAREGVQNHEWKVAHPPTPFPRGKGASDLHASRQRDASLRDAPLLR